MKTRNAKKTATMITATQFDEAMMNYAAAELREEEINKVITTGVQELMTQHEAELQQLATEKQTSFEIALSYCMNNKQQLFGKRRSIGTEYGIAGFRLGTPKLKTAKNSNWKSVLVELKKTLPEYVRSIEEPAKDLLLADRNTEKVAPLLMQIGVQVVQDELFYIETKKAA